MLVLLCAKKKKKKKKKMSASRIIAFKLCIWIGFQNKNFPL